MPTAMTAEEVGKPIINVWNNYDNQHRTIR